MQVFAILALECVLFGGVLGNIFDIPWTKAINAKVCENGTLPDDVAEKFFACYDSTITPGGEDFVHCQSSVFGVTLNSKANFTKACAVAGERIPKYAACIAIRLEFHRVLPSKAMEKLNECQGAVMGVENPAISTASE